MLVRAVKNFAIKGPIDQDSAQQQADEAWRYIVPFLTDKEADDLMDARDLALKSGNRKKFDKVMSPITKRLLNLSDENMD